MCLYKPEPMSGEFSFVEFMLQRSIEEASPKEDSISEYTAGTDDAARKQDDTLKAPKDSTNQFDMIMKSIKYQRENQSEVAMLQSKVKTLQETLEQEIENSKKLTRELETSRDLFSRHLLKVASISGHLQEEKSRSSALEAANAAKGATILERHAELLKLRTKAELAQNQIAEIWKEMQNTPTGSGNGNAGDKAHLRPKKRFNTDP